MRRWTLLALVFAVVGLSAAELPPAWEGWRYWRAVELTASEPPRPALPAPSAVEVSRAEGLAKVTVPIEVYGRAQTNLGDLRLMDDTGTEAPYTLEARHGHRRRQWQDAPVVDLGEIPGAGTHAVAEIPAEVTRHNSIEILTEESDFIAWVEVAASAILPPPDREESAWRVIREGAHIFRLRKDGLEGVQTVSYPLSTARFLRLRIRREGGQGLKLTGIRVAYEEVEEPELVRLPVEKVTQPRGAQGQSLWQVDLGSGQVPVSQVRFEVGTPAFHRGVEVLASEDGERWVRAGAATLHRVAALRGDLIPGKPAQFGVARAVIAQLSADSGIGGLVVEFPEHRGRYWRVVVTDRNDAPLSGVRIELWGTPRHLLFRLEPRRSYRLVYGNERAAAPQYELARLLPPEEREQAVTATVGSEEVNTAWVDPRPWSERNPVVLWVALGIVVAALGLLALRSLRQAA